MAVQLKQGGLALVEHIAAWLRANGIDPNTVPYHAIPAVVHRPDGPAQLVCPVMVRHDEVQLVIDKEPAVTAIVRDLVTEPPPTVAAWLDQAVTPPHPEIGG
jgi:hypothetical protein